ncbi:hypothetical protein CP01DC11_1382A, partial [Chlamydia psittaci 01DC11]
MTGLNRFGPAQTRPD